MSVHIVLLNGHIREATELPGELFEYSTERGRIVIKSRDQIKAVVREDEVEDPISDHQFEPQQKEEVVIYHFLRQITTKEEGKPTNVFEVRYIQNYLEPQYEADYLVSATTRRPSNDIFAVSTGSWGFKLLEEMIKDKKYRVMIIENKHVDPSLIRPVVYNSTAAWANASYTFILKVEGESWGFNALRMEVDHSKKTPKRLQEVIRLTEVGLKVEADVDSNYDIDFEFPEVDGPEAWYDGKTYLSEKFMIRCAMTIKNNNRRRRVIREIRSGAFAEGMFRIDTPMGKLKGNFQKHANKNAADITTDIRGFKNQTRTDGYMFVSFQRHELAHIAVWDDQSACNFSHALPERVQKSDISRMVRSLMDVLTTHTMPEWLTMGEPGHTDTGVPTMEQLSETVSKTWLRLQSHGLGIEMLQNLVHMGFNGVPERMKTPKLNGYHKKMWIVMSNAMLLSVNTYQSATRMGGMTFIGRDRNKCFFDPRAGLVIPGSRFVETYHLHGGWDLDDSVKVIKIMLWCSDPSVIEMHAGKTISRHWPIPTRRENAVLKALFVRSPNGPGEYSIEEFDWNGFPLPDELSHNDITIVDLAKMPIPQDVMLENVDLAGLPTSVQYSQEPITQEDAIEMILAQKLNPGVGRFCNAMMLWASAYEGYPEYMLDKMENIVDSSQQDADKVSFEAINDAPDSIYAQMIEGGHAVDVALSATRMPAAVRREIQTYKGRFYNVQNEYIKAIDFIKNEIHDTTLQWRQTNPIVRYIIDRPIPASYLKRAQKFFLMYSFAFSEVEKQFEVLDDMSPFKKMNMAYNKKLGMEAIVDEMVHKFELIKDDDERYRAVIALYKYIVTPSLPRDPYGISDRVIAQAAAIGHKNVMDILIEALYHYGLVPSE